MNDEINDLRAQLLTVIDERDRLAHAINTIRTWCGYDFRKADANGAWASFVDGHNSARDSILEILNDELG